MSKRAMKITPIKLEADWEEDQVTHMMCTRASIRILSRMIADKELDTEGVLRYLAYMLRVTQLTGTYTWKSVILYDRRCRMLQASTKEGCDVEPNGVGSTTLVRKQLPKQKHGDGGHNLRTLAGAREIRDTSVLEPCQLFNLTGKCKYLQITGKCKFMHVCTVCRGQHPAMQHPTPIMEEMRMPKGPGFQGPDSMVSHGSASMQPNASWPYQQAKN